MLAVTISLVWAGKTVILQLSGSKTAKSGSNCLNLSKIAQNGSKLPKIVQKLSNKCTQLRKIAKH